MLKTRVLTAVVLLVLFLSAIFILPATGWVVFVTIVATLAAWEWGGLLALGQAGRLALGAGFAALCFCITLRYPAALGLNDEFLRQAWGFGRWIYAPALAFWGLVVPLWMWRHWRLPKSLAGVFIGLMVLLPTWLALIQLRPAGAWVLLAIMATVWVADSAAYFAGRRFGRHKLAPSISPGKTWEGAFGAACAVVIYGLALADYLPAVLAGNRLLLIIVLLLVTSVSIIGDLFESLLKRKAGIKDSSQILPGHGGVLDRIDSLTSTLPLVALFWLASLHWETL